jgi:outer membrane protein OmpA-like peptidoglycan-associated protein
MKNQIIKILIISSIVNMVVVLFLLIFFSKSGILCPENMSNENQPVLLTDTLTDTISKTETPIVEKNPDFFNADRINFETNSYKLTVSAKEELKLLAYVMLNDEKYKNLCLDIEGHTDDVGDSGRNLILSNNRANAVKSVLIKNGVDISRISSVGYGEDNPIAPNTTIKGRKINRRVDFVFKTCN